MDIVGGCCWWKKWIAGFAIIILISVFSYLGKKSVDSSVLRQKRQRKKKSREQEFRAVGRDYGTLKADAEEIVNLPEAELIAKLQKRQLTAKKVLDAFISKAYQIHQNHNCIVEYIPKAHAWADELDKLDQVKGPLHGVPVSIKDNCDIEGHDSTLGLVKKCYDPKKEHAVIVKVLMDLGAIPFLKTNVPQTLLSIGCSNPLFGETTNFLNPTLSPGGSSGGEATLLAGGGSILGIGSDIGGSVRIPAHFSGIFGFKPTNHRLSSTGFTASLPNLIGVAGVPGIMTKSIDMMILATKLLLEENRQHNYDQLALPIPWNNKPFEEKRKLRIGYYTSLPYFPLVGDTESIVLNAKSALEKDGHTLVPYIMPDGHKIMNLMGGLSFADLGAHMCKNWKGEEIPSALLPNYLAFHLPLWLKKVVANLMELPIPFLHSKRGSVFVRGGAGVSKDLMDRMGERKGMILDLIRQWKELQLDLVLCPTFPFPAIPKTMTNRMQSAIIYTITWNVFDFPSGVVKWGKETGKKILPYEHQNDFMLRPVPKAVKEAIGMPISVQLVGLPYEDEMVLYGMKCLNSLYPDVKE